MPRGMTCTSEKNLDVYAYTFYMGKTKPVKIF